MTTSLFKVPSINGLKNKYLIFKARFPPSQMFIKLNSFKISFWAHVTLILESFFEHFFFLNWKY
jgi:hypothetical protein